VSVVCGKLEAAEDDRDAITNPRVVVEVLSKSRSACSWSSRVTPTGPGLDAVYRDPLAS
jgi:hypothetical protein